MNNTELYAAARQAIDNLFSDTSVPKSETLSNLRSLRDDLVDLIDSIDDDDLDPRT